MLKQLAYSIYLSKYRENPSIIDELNLKDSFVFTSLHISEEFNETYVEEIKIMYKKIKEKQSNIIADVSQRTLDIFKCSTIIELVNKLNIDYVRLDFGFDDEETIRLSQSIPIVLNASTISDSLLMMKTKESQLYAMHNYYPRTDTGLDENQVLTMNKKLIKHGIPSFLFIPGENLRGPIFEGLPTIELHRKQPAYVNYVSILNKQLADYVFVGDVGLAKTQEILIERYNEDGIIRIPVSGELIKPYCNISYTNRIDSPNDLIRFQESRVFATQGEVVEPQNCIERIKGAITIDNKHYLRYSGEIQIMKKNYKQSDKINVIGNVVDIYFPLLELIKPKDKFMLINMEEMYD